MSEPLRFVPPRVQLVDPRTGMISREWYLFFQGVFGRIGGADGVGTAELESSLFEDAGSSETNAMLFDLNQTVEQYPVCPQVNPEDNIVAELSELRDRVAELVKDLESIKQGILI